MAEINKVKLNIDEVKDFMKHIITNNRELQATGKNSVAVEVVGESGIGKTSSMLQLAKEMELNIVKLNLAQIEELGDLVGFPVRQFQLCKTGAAAPVVKQAEVGKQKFVTKMVDGQLTRVPVEDESATPAVTANLTTTANTGECIWVDELATPEYTKRGYEFTGQKRMAYCPPEWIADKQGGGILILDDWNRADIRFIQAVMELVDRQEYISWKLPKDWHIVLTANPDNGDYLVNSIDTAQRTRFISVDLDFNIDVWGKWAEKEGIDSRCINFMLLHPEMVNQKTNPRSITTFYNAISSIKNFSDSLALVQMIGEGSVGPEFSTAFTLFINNKLDKLPNPKDVLLHENEQHIVGELRSCTGRVSTDKYRADIASILCTRIVNFSLNYAEKNPITPAINDRLIRLMTDEEIFNNDLKYFLVKGILNGNKQKFGKVMMNPDVIAMASK